MTDGRIDPACVNTELSDVIQKLDVTVLKPAPCVLGPIVETIFKVRTFVKGYGCLGFIKCKGTNIVNFLSEFNIITIDSRNINTVIVVVTKRISRYPRSARVLLI